MCPITNVQNANNFTTLFFILVTGRAEHLYFGNDSKCIRICTRINSKIVLLILYEKVVIYKIFKKNNNKSINR